MSTDEEETGSASGRFRLVRLGEWSLRHERSGRYLLAQHHEENGHGWGVTKEWDLGIPVATNADELLELLRSQLPLEIPRGVASALTDAIVRMVA